MRTYNGKSRYSDDEMRAKVETLSAEERENLIQKLGVSHLVFENWMDAKDKLVNSKVIGNSFFTVLFFTFKS